MMKAIPSILLVFMITGCTMKEQVDPNGYIIYCPCMGRFGNQADQFLGSFAFAKALNRTLVLPPWVTYPSKRPYQSEQISFYRWFKVDPLRQYHRVITMEKFMKKLAKDVWPVGKRKAFCYNFRGEKNCQMKDGNPFGPFWDHFKIEFDEDFIHEPLIWSTDSYSVSQWQKRFPPSSFPVLVFKGAPASFPSKKKNHFIQNYIHFSKHIEDIADAYIKKELEGKKFLAIHLRNGNDMRGACKGIASDKYKELFSSNQCTELDGNSKLTVDMCDPPREKVVSDVVHYVKSMKLKALYVATDNDPMIKDFEKALKKFKVTIHQRKHKDTNTEFDAPLIDIAIMSKADMFIGNCVSSFTAFVRRQRLSRGKPISFFNIKLKKPIHTEL